MEPTRRLGDAALAEEIEMYGELVVAASESDHVLPTEEIDRLLGVPSSARRDDERRGAPVREAGPL